MTSILHFTLAAINVAMFVVSNSPISAAAAVFCFGMGVASAIRDS